jgi:TolB-like protein/DNA-binding SARP family transcriptional activator/tetratricopeptide (TPR) repeat protein
VKDKELLHVCVLGDLSVVRCHTRVQLPPSKKTRALLAYLAVTARPHRRDRLCTMFWGVPDDPRAALRWSLSHLRPLIDDHDGRRIIADRESVGLDLSCATVDVLVLRNAARGGVESMSTKALREAAQALEGEFLEGLDLPDCDQFQIWCTAEREETRRLRVRVLATLVARLESEPDEALPYARTLSQLEPADEAAQATLVRLLRASGRWREAEEQFQRAQQRLDELNVVRTGTLRLAAQAPLQTDAPDASARDDSLERSPSALPRSDRPAIAVLPFLNMSGEPEQDYFSDGISEDIIAALSKLRWFLVIARNSSFAYKGKSVPMKQIAEELGIGYLVEGSVRKSGDRVRITAQLNDVATGTQLWAERYDHGLADVFKVQDEITTAIVAAIEPQVYAAENFRAQRKSPESLDAWELLMRALSHYWRVTREDNILAQALLEKAIAIDPNYAQALAVLAVSHNFGAHMGWEDKATAFPVAERAAVAALRADGDDPWARLAIATVHGHQGRFGDALAEYEATLRLNPNFSLALGYYGLTLSYIGRWQEGADAAYRARRLSPRDPFSAICSGVAAYAEFVGRNYEEAMRLAREGIRQRIDFVSGYRILTAAAAMAGHMDVARAALEELRRAQPNISLAWYANHAPGGEAEREHYLEALRRAGLD